MEYLRTMNPEKLNHWFTLIANVGVLIGIIFLALELRQNTEMMKAQTRDAMTEKQMGFYELQISNPEVSKSFLDYTGYQTSAEQFPAFTIIRSQLRMWENEWYQYQKGLFEDEEFAPRISLWRTMLTSENYRSFWQRVRGEHSPGLRAQIDSIVEELNGTAN